AEVDDLVGAPVADHLRVVAGAGLAVEDDVVVGIPPQADLGQRELVGPGLGAGTRGPDLDHRCSSARARMLPQAGASRRAAPRRPAPPGGPRRRGPCGPGRPPRGPTGSPRPRW